MEVLDREVVATLLNIGLRSLRIPSPRTNFDIHYRWIRVIGDNIFQDKMGCKPEPSEALITLVPRKIWKYLRTLSGTLGSEDREKNLSTNLNQKALEHIALEDLVTEVPMLNTSLEVLAKPVCCILENMRAVGKRSMRGLRVRNDKMRMRHRYYVFE
ncbi:hypothetical protein PIB30_028475 [Stylosanthes scabra]|uniref:Uncharacterized protein n=1 Tax=Stylosanthes scabra TaxID=79078 RepID=A0ABU6Y987_9FABA|nr:hypothetical protein [Stylosanthes scabra]